jgi:NADPH-dependent curcumin reductase CurA
LKEETVSREIHLRERPIGIPTEGNFVLVKSRIPNPKEGQFVVHNIWMSVDPYMRGRMRGIKTYISPFELNKPLEGSCVGQVVESKSDRFKIGDFVLSNYGWREYWVSTETNSVTKIDPKIAPIQSYLGIMGLTGLTAYVGLLKVGKLEESDRKQNTVFISAAAGAVGSVSCQIAKIMGCRVIGSTGSQEKVSWLLKEAKIDNAFNYKEMGEENISSHLNRQCPDGIDIYFDNVGGKHLEAAIHNMKTFGIVVLCGMISQYNLSSPQGLSNLMLAVTNRLRLQGFIVRDHYDMLVEFHANMTKWIKEEKIKWRETIFEGLENAPKAFLALFNGQNIGKMLVRL